MRVQPFDLQPAPIINAAIRIVAANETQEFALCRILIASPFGSEIGLNLSSVVVRAGTGRIDSRGEESVVNIRIRALFLSTFYKSSLVGRGPLPGPLTDVWLLASFPL